MCVKSTEVTKSGKKGKKYPDSTNVSEFFFKQEKKNFKTHGAF